VGYLLLREGHIRQAFFHHQLCGYAGHGDVADLGDQGHSAGGPGIGLQNIDLVLGQSVLHIHEAHHLQLPGDALGVLLDGLNVPLRYAHRGDDAGRIARMNAGQLDVLHHRRNKGLYPVGEGIGLHLQGIVQEAVDENGPLRGDVNRRQYIPLQHLLVEDDLHSPAA